MAVVARQLWETSGLGPDDMQAAILYDHFTRSVLYQFEALGFCAKGEAKDFVRDGRIDFGGTLPINTHGGQLGEAYLHGMNGIAEGVRLVRGSSVNQVEGLEHVVVTAAPACRRADWCSASIAERGGVGESASSLRLPRAHETLD